MKKRRGFTLIELLAVIVILAIIALIAVPVILNIIDKANKSAFKDTAYGIVNAAELYFAEQQLEPNGMATDQTFELPSQVNATDGLQLKGEVPAGIVKVITDGKVALAIQNGRYCITKGFDDADVAISEDVEHCYVPQTLAALSVEEIECATDRTPEACGLGTLFTLRVNDNESKDFYVMKDEGDKVTLIMSENLGHAAWYDGPDGCETIDEGPFTYTKCTNEYGPITAINKLDELTDEEWSNIPKRGYTYSGFGTDGQKRAYPDIIRTMRARMITYNDAISAGCSGVLAGCPSWMMEHLDDDVDYGYWSSTVSANQVNTLACGINKYSSLDCTDTIANIAGIRPVIELSK